MRVKGINKNMIRQQWNNLLENRDEVVEYLNERRVKGKRIDYRQLRKLL